MSDTPHRVYDDIVEEDNQLPRWWLATLFGAIVFSFGYWFVYHSTRSLPLPAEEHRLEQEAKKLRQQDERPPNEETLLALVADHQALAQGEKVFKANCITCHGARGEGLVGPNLTDKAWIHGGAPMAVHASISRGFPDKGMPQWEKMLGKANVMRLSAWVVAQKNKNLTGKAPQGTEEP